MKSMRIPLITLALTVGAASAAWGAESVMNLISTGEAVQKEVTDTKAKTEASEKQNKDLAQEGRDLNTAQTKLNTDIQALNKDADSITQRRADFATQCPSGKTFTPDQLTACKNSAAQINADIAANTAKNAELKKRQDDFTSKAKSYNETVKNNPGDVKGAYDAFNAAIKKEAAWLDAARDRISSEGFKSYATKAGCPDVNKPSKTTEAMMKMTDEVIACLKKVSNS